MDARPVLGVSSLRPPLLVDLPSARPREGETGGGTRVVTHIDSPSSRGPRAPYFELEDDFEDDLDEDDDDEDGDDEDSEDDDEDSDTETWQVSSARRFR